MRRRNFIILSYIFCFFCIAKNGFAQSSYQGMGGAGHSMVAPVNASLLNPALLGYITQNHAHTYYFQEVFEEQGFKESWQTYGISIVDSQTSPLFPGAFSYIRSKESENEITKNLYKLAIGRKEYEKVSFGFTINRLEYESQLIKETEHDVSVGITYAPIELWGLSVVVDNIRNGDFLGTKYILATYYIYDPFLKLNLDLIREDGQVQSDPSIKTGVSFPFGEFDLNFGYKSLAELDREYFTFGLTWRGPRLGASYAYQELSSDGKGDGHFVDIGFFF